MTAWRGGCSRSSSPTPGLSVGRIGVLVALYPAVWGLGQLYTGNLSDRIGRKPLDRRRHARPGRRHRLDRRPPPGSTSWALGALVLGAGTAMVYPTLLAAVGDVAHPAWRARAVGVYRLWRDAGFAVGALLAGLLADLISIDRRDLGRRRPDRALRPDRRRSHVRDPPTCRGYITHEKLTQRLLSNHAGARGPRGGVRGAGRSSCGVGRCHSTGDRGRAGLLGPLAVRAAGTVGARVEPARASPRRARRRRPDCQDEVQRRRPSPVRAPARRGVGRPGASGAPWARAGAVRVHAQLGALPAGRRSLGAAHEHDGAERRHSSGGARSSRSGRGRSESGVRSEQPPSEASR